jgi:hypothetical protein
MFLMADNNPRRARYVCKPKRWIHARLGDVGFIVLLDLLPGNSFSK